MPQLKFEDFITSFRKQFVFQTGRGGRRISPYYTAQNSEQGLKNDQWALMIFIYMGNLYGFSDLEMINELRIRKSLYEELKDVTPCIIKREYHDKLLHKKVITKISLVKNYILYTHGVKLQSPYPTLEELLRY